MIFGHLKNTAARVLKMSEKTVKHCGDGYEVGLLWNEKNVELCVVAEKHLESTERMQKQKDEVSATVSIAR